MLPRLQQAGRRPFFPGAASWSSPFWDGLAKGEWRTTQCLNCGYKSFPPFPICPSCGQDTAWTDMATEGTLYTQTTLHAAAACFSDHVPLTLAVVDLADGVRLLTWLVGSDAGPQFDSAVEMIALVYDDGPLFAARLKI